MAATRSPKPRAEGDPPRRSRRPPARAEQPPGEAAASPARAERHPDEGPEPAETEKRRENGRGGEAAAARLGGLGA